MACPYSSKANDLTLTSFSHPPPINDMTCSKTSQHRHVHKTTIYKFIFLSAMNLKYLLRKSCIGCVPIHYDIQQVHTVFKREVHRYYITKSCMIVQANQNLHTHFKCAYVFQGKDGTCGTWYLSHIKVTRIKKWLTLRVCYCAFKFNDCLLFFVFFT